jgi:ATP-dependent Clp protease adaptor protein ClpS
MKSYDILCSATTHTQEATVLETSNTGTQPPPLYKVYLINDDYTPMDFVVVILQNFFGMNRERATQIMLQVHREGIGICGIYSKEVATIKVEQVVAFARQHQHPLACAMEEVE